MLKYGLYSIITVADWNRWRLCSAPPAQPAWLADVSEPQSFRVAPSILASALVHDWPSPPLHREAAHTIRLRVAAAFPRAIHVHAVAPEAVVSLKPPHRGRSAWQLYSEALTSI